MVSVSIALIDKLSLALFLPSRFVEEEVVVIPSRVFQEKPFTPSAPDDGETSFEHVRVSSLEICTLSF